MWALHCGMWDAGIPNQGSNPGPLHAQSLNHWTTRKKESEVVQSCPTLCHPMDFSPPGSSVCGTLQARILEWVAMPSSRGSSQPWDRIQAANIVGRVFTSLPSELPGKPKNTGVGSLSLLKGITQESNSGLLHCRQILHQLNYQKIPK